MVQLWFSIGLVTLLAGLVHSQYFDEESYNAGDAAIKEMFGPRVGLWKGSQLKRAKRQACGTCVPPTIGMTNIFEGIASCNEQFDYSTDANGCQQITVSCTGYGNVIIITNTTADSQGLANYTLQDISVLSTVTVQMSCLTYGWGADTTDSQILDNEFTCQVDQDVPNPPACPNTDTTTTTAPTTTTTTPTTTTTTPTTTTTTLTTTTTTPTTTTTTPTITTTTPTTTTTTPTTTTTTPTTTTTTPTTTTTTPTTTTTTPTTTTTTPTTTTTTPTTTTTTPTTTTTTPTTTTTTPTTTTTTPTTTTTTPTTTTTTPTTTTTTPTTTTTTPTTTTTTPTTTTTTPTTTTTTPTTTTTTPTTTTTTPTTTTTTPTTTTTTPTTTTTTPTTTTTTPTTTTTTPTTTTTTPTTTTTTPTTTTTTPTTTTTTPTTTTTTPTTTTTTPTTTTTTPTTTTTTPTTTTTTPTTTTTTPTTTVTTTALTTTSISSMCCAPGGTWSEWTQTPSQCSDYCGSCGNATMTRTCLSASTGCPCTGTASYSTQCNTGVCYYPRLSCCPGYSAMLLNGTFQCGIYPTINDTTPSPAPGCPSCCPDNGIWSDWTPISACNDTCGSCGTQQVTRTCLSSSYGCSCSGVSSFNQSCASNICEYPRASCCSPYIKKLVNGTFFCGPITAPPSNVTNTTCCPPGGMGLWSPWTNWASCSATCGLCGTQTRNRTCSSAQFGCPCTGNSTQTQSCNPAPCNGTCCSGKYLTTGYDGYQFCQDTPPTTCTGTWTNWTNVVGSTCNDTCGNCGVVSQQRYCFPSGCQCSGDFTGMNPCNNSICLYPRASCCAPSKKVISGGKFFCG